MIDAQAATTITGLVTEPGGITVTMSDGSERGPFSWRWLRDHSEDPASLDPSTRQRLVDTFALPANLKGESADIVDSGRRLVVAWNDGSPPSELPAQLMNPDVDEAVPYGARRCGSVDGEHTSTPIRAFDDVAAGGSGLFDWLSDVATHGFGVVQGFPPTQQSADDLAALVGYPRQTIFGAMWTLSSEVTDHDDSAYSNSYLEPHTDSTYSIDAPGLQLFCCLEREGTGGESILVDGYAVAEEMRLERPDLFETLTTVDVIGRYIEPGVHLEARRPAIRLDAAGAIEQVSFNNYDRAPFWLGEPLMTSFYEAYADLHRRVNDRTRWSIVRIEPGEALLFDNWRSLHGRQSYTGRRVFRGCYHNREDFLSRIRVLGAELTSASGSDSDSDSV